MKIQRIRLGPTHTDKSREQARIYKFVFHGIQEVFRFPVIVYGFAHPEKLIASDDWVLHNEVGATREFHDMEFKIIEILKIHSKDESFFGIPM